MAYWVAAPMTNRIKPVMFTWTGDSMVPMERFKNLCTRQFEKNESYALGPIEGVPSRSRAAFFACISDAWNSLPENDERYPSKEHLRHVALVKAGWASHSQSVMDTPKDARKFAIGMRKVAEYAVIKVSENVVDVWIAKSIATGQIHGDEWKAVMTKALDWVATLARTTRAELEANAGRAA